MCYRLRMLCLLVGLLAVVSFSQTAWADNKACPATSEAISHTLRDVGLPEPVLRCWAEGEKCGNDLAQWLGYSLGIAIKRSQPGSRNRECLKQLDHYYQRYAEKDGFSRRYTLGYMGAPPPRFAGSATNPDRIADVFHRAVQVAVSRASTRSNVDAEFAGAWNLVELSLVADGKVVSKNSEIAPGSLVVGLGEDGRMSMDIHDPKTNQKSQHIGAWSTSDNGRTLTQHLEGEAPADCQVLKLTEEDMVLRCYETFDGKVRTHQIMAYRRVDENTTYGSAKTLYEVWKPPYGPGVRCMTPAEAKALEEEGSNVKSLKQPCE